MDRGSAFGTNGLRLLVWGLLLGAVPAPSVWGQIPEGRVPTRVFEGQALYEKVHVTSSGLDLTRSSFVPIRNAEVDVFDRLTGEVVFVTETDSQGGFYVQVPAEGAYRVRVLGRSTTSGVVVADNTDGWRIYSVETNVPDVSDRGPLTLRALDSDRVSGAFNILEVLGQADAFLQSVEPGIETPALTVLWSPKNHRATGNLLEGQIGSTTFDAATGVAFVLGDRTTDSDEFDDAVLLHEYAHLLSKRFSRDDSIGGPHAQGDVLDPRVAWSEGWANFFSSLVRNDPMYRDSFDPGGAAVLEYDLEDNMPTDPGAGYRGEVSVHRVLWDLVDHGSDPGDNVQIPRRAIWQAFRRLSEESFVYLTDFLDVLSRVVPSQIPAIEQTAWSHFIDYIHMADPAVLNPFPKLVSGSVVTGELDSWSRQRANLAQSAHLYTFETRGGAVSIRLGITGLGPAGNSLANDLDLVLMDSEGRVIARSDGGLNGQGEAVLAFLPEGTYILEVRSFYRSQGSTRYSFNSGAYRLTIVGP